MKFADIFIYLLMALCLAACGGGGGGGGIGDGGGGGGSTPVAVPVTLNSITVTPPDVSLFTGYTRQYRAVGSYSDGTTLDLTSSVTWSSSTITVAIISSSGLATALIPGTTLITATLATVAGSAPLSVTLLPSNVNIMPVTVNGSLCSAGSYANKPCVQVTICNPGTATCQTINDILLDTGSYGLRIFKQVIAVPLTQTTVSGNPLAECIQYVDGSAQWGPVQLADVILGGEPAVTVPIQVIDSAFGSVAGVSAVPGSCGTPESSPAVAGFNGILGVGLFAEDCGLACQNGAANGRYFTCSGGTCSGSKVPIANQVQNPVAWLPIDNNGVILQLPAARAGGSTSVNGQLLIGINTRANNISTGVTSFPTSSNGYFSTKYNGITYASSFIDSGSNGLFFNSSGTIPMCSGWYCPPSTLNLSATNIGSGGAPSGNVAFQIGNAGTLFSTSYRVFAELGSTSSFGFDWGLPFFLGRSVYVGISGRSGLILGTGPYWAY